MSKKMNKHLRLAALVTAALGLAAAANATELFWGGSGTWSESKWSTDDAAPSYVLPWNDDGTVGPTFIGTGGTVIVDGTYHVGNPGIGFDADGVILSGGTLIRTHPLVNAPAAAGQTVTISSELQGTVGLTKGRAGTVILTGTNTYTGITQISAGVLRATEGTGLPNASYLKLNGGVYETSGAFTRVNSTVVDGANFQWSANNGGFSAYSGKLTVTIGNDAAIEQVWVTANTNNGIRGTLKFGSTKANAETEFQNNINLNNGTRTIEVAAGAGGDFATISGVIRNSTGTGALTKTGAGTLVLSNTNTYNGTTTISTGTLSVGADGNLGNANSLVFNGGTLQVTGTAMTGFGTHTPAFTAAKTVGLDIADAGNTFTVSQVMDQTAGGLTKGGAGTLVLSNANTYSGPTAVNAGTLKVNGSIQGSAVTVNNAGTILTGGASVKSLTVNAGAVVSPGDGVGTLDVVAGNVYLAANAVYRWEFGGGTNADVVNVSGNLTLADDWELKLVDAGGTPRASQQYDLFTFSGTSAPLGTFTIDATAVAWDTTNANIVVDDSAGRVYITGIGSSVVAGDTNGDGAVDAADYVTLKKNFGAGVGGGAAAGNFDGVGTVNWADLGILMSNMGTGGAASAPEPCSAILLMFGAAAIVRRRRSA
jgi:autotransporter-associated beta strand protein